MIVDEIAIVTEIAMVTGFEQFVVLLALPTW